MMPPLPKPDIFHERWHHNSSGEITAQLPPEIGFYESTLIAYGRQCVEALKTKLPGGRITDKWESSRIADYNHGWNDYRKSIRNMLKGETECQK
jgi:hypothetical protein